MTKIKMYLLEYSFMNLHPNATLEVIHGDLESWN